MMRSALYILAAIVAVVFGFDQADQPAFVATSGPEVSVRLTQAETDCIVGGDAGCWTEAKQAAGECISSGIISGDLDSTAELLDCYAVGAWTGVVCVFNWFLDLF